MATELTPELEQLLRDPNFAHLATVRPDGSPQSNVMWFEWDGEVVRFTHTSNRQKFKNFEHEPRIAFSVVNAANPYKFLEVRGTVEKIKQDTADAAFYKSLQQRYGMDYPIADADVRVLVTVRPTAYASN